MPAGFMCGRQEVQAKLRNQLCEEDCRCVLQSFSPGYYNSCCSRRAAAVSPGRLRQPARSPISTQMREHTIRKARMAQVEQWPNVEVFHQKPQYSDSTEHGWNSGTMQIRYCGSVDKSSRPVTDVSNKRRYAVRIVPLFQRRFSPLQSCGFWVERFSDRHCSTCSTISEVII